MSLFRRIPFQIWMVVILFGLQLWVAISQAQEAPKQILVVEVRKKLQLTSKDPVVRDYYVNSGTNSGLKSGAFVTVYRRLPLADPNREKTQTHVEVPVGVMRVIYADSSTSIGRIHAIRSVADSPILDSDVFMVGDRLDMSTLGFEKRSAGPPAAEPTTPNPTANSAAETESPAEIKPPPTERTTASEPKIAVKEQVKALPAQAKSVEILTK